jgi:hypothetical protein
MMTSELSPEGSGFHSTHNFILTRTQMTKQGILISLVLGPMMSWITIRPKFRVLFERPYRRIRPPQTFQLLHQQGIYHRWTGFTFQMLNALSMWNPKLKIRSHLFLLRDAWNKRKPVMYHKGQTTKVPTRIQIVAMVWRVGYITQRKIAQVVTNLQTRVRTKLEIP